jgi:limonene-1,2-epoxide hydrolase
VSHKEYSVFFLVCPLFAWVACSGPGEQSTVRGTLANAAQELEARDAVGLFATLDERTRFAMIATVNARREARALIEADYPESEKARALEALGVAAQVTTGAELFARRCDDACLGQLADVVGAPASEVARGDEIEVTTVRGRTLRMHAGTSGGYGIVWSTRESADERAQASRELARIKENAEVYRRRRALMDSAGGAPR